MPFSVEDRSAIKVLRQDKQYGTETLLTRSQAVARIADRTASQQTLVISDCC